jgi:flagellar biosynthesis protein FlhF
MKYIKIRGNNYNEVMMKLKMEHGDDAIPISHKFVKEGGLFSSRLFAREVVELTAAVQERKFKSSLSGGTRKIDFTIGDGEKTGRDPQPLRTGEGTDRPSYAPPAPPKAERAAKGAGFSPGGMQPGFNPAGPLERNTEGQARSEAARVASNRREDMPEETFRPDAGAAENLRVEKELEEIKRAIYKIGSGRQADDEPVSHEEVNIRPFRLMLKNNDYDEDQCNSIINKMKNSISREDLKDKYKIEKSLRDLLKSRIVTAGPIKAGSKKKIIVFIGPTGVGKTTTMAKLGAINSLRDGNRVCFVTIDNYRIAATEQLKKYAEIMNIPIHTVNSQKEFKDTIAAENADIIMVDTSGRSHRNDLKISEIKNFVDAAECDCEKLLCVSANTKKSDLNDVFMAFDAVNINSVVITKVDETSYIGNVIDIAEKYHKPISYVTNGQEVPNDIFIADPDKIVDMMIGNG